MTTRSRRQNFIPVPALRRAGAIFAGKASILFLAATSLSAQERLGSGITVTLSPAFESRSFGGGGLTQPTLGGGSTVPLTSVTQISLPLALSIPLLADKWNLDLSAGFASNKVSLGATDTETQSSGYSLSGITDTKVRITGKLAEEKLLLTLGLNVPTGATELDAEQLSALRIVAAPAVGLQIPQLGAGGGGTVGLVFARRFSDWAWALGTSYEKRSGYTPISFGAGIPVPDFDPGDIIHISLGGDGLVGRNGMSVGVSADIFSEDKVDSQGTTSPGTQLGPIFIGEWRLRMASSRFQELSISVVDRFRTPYKRNGATVEGSSANYLDVSLLAAHSASPRTTFTWELSAKHQTGLKADSSLISAAMSGGGLRLSIARQLSNGGVLQPYAGVQFMKLKNGSASGSATGITVGLTVAKGL